MTQEQYNKMINDILNTKPEVKEASVEATILPFFSYTTDKMDDPIVAIKTHINNLINTYGEDAIKQAFAELTVEASDGQ